jgi:hypothetical protein
VYLRPLLLGLAPDDTSPAIISSPENGWHQLRDILENDLRAEPAVLMQQIRTMLLGLRQLPALTPREYRRAGGIHGVEMLVVSRGIQRAANAAGGGEVALSAARGVLGALVQRGRSDQPSKAQRASIATLAEAAQSAEQATAIVEQLQKEELVRPADSVGGTPAWQLDHDYLARAVILESQQANRLVVALCDAKTRYDRAPVRWRWWTASLGIPTLIGVLWGRLRGRLTIGDAGRYVAISLVRPGIQALCLFAAIVGGYAWSRDQALTAEAMHIVDRFGVDYAINASAAFDVWRASDRLRARVFTLVRADRSRLYRAINTDWLTAHVGLDPDDARDAAVLLREELLKSADDQRYLRDRLLRTYSSVVKIIDAGGLETERLRSECVSSSRVAPQRNRR